MTAVLDALGVVVSVLALLAAPAAVWFHRRYVAPRRELERRELLDTVAQRIEQAVAPVREQMRNNGGSTFRDSIEGRLDELKVSNGREFREIKDHLGRQDRRIDTLFAGVRQ